jgi:hypothetical protein
MPAPVITALPTAPDIADPNNFAADASVFVAALDPLRTEINSFGTYLNSGIEFTSPFASIDINGGTIDGTVIGGATRAAGSFTALTATGAFTSLGIDDNATSTAVTLDSSGNVGIGTATPATKLEVEGSSVEIRATASTTGAGLGLYALATNTGTRNWGVYSNKNTFGDFVIQQSSTLGGTPDTTRFTIDPIGHVAIGTGSGSVFTVSKSFASVTSIATIENLANTSGNQVLKLNMGSATNNAASYFIIAQNPGVAIRFQVLGNGDVDNVNNSYGAISDRKLKEDIVDSTSQWEDLKAVRVRKYKLKEDKGLGKTHIGVVAQELEDAGMNGLVSERDDLDEDGVATGTVTKSVRYSLLYMKAVLALQEAMARIEALEAQNAAFELRLIALETAP